MVEYVYALHDFTPENPDEVPFKAGEKIEVVEKDELYQDGWWQVSTRLNCILANCQASIPNGVDCAWRARGDGQDSCFVR